jgi:hypothetical protein
MSVKKTKKKPAGLCGKEILRAAVNQIIDHPDTWEQSMWHSECGTEHCIAGWCQILSGHRADSRKVCDDAIMALGISKDHADWLFNPLRSLPEIHAFTENLLKGNINWNGDDRDGDDKADKKLPRL